MNNHFKEHKRKKNICFTIVHINGSCHCILLNNLQCSAWPFLNKRCTQHQMENKIRNNQETEINCMYMKWENRIIKGEKWWVWDWSHVCISGKDGFFPPFFSENCSRLMLSIRMVGKLRGACRHRTFQYGLLQVIEHRRILFGQEGHGYPTLSSTTRSANTMDIV